MNYRLDSLAETAHGKPIAYIYTYIYTGIYTVCIYIYTHPCMYISSNFKGASTIYRVVFTYLCIKASWLIFQNSTPFMKKFLLLNTNLKLEQKVPVKVRGRYLKGPKINS